MAQSSRDTLSIASKCRTVQTVKLIMLDDRRAHHVGHLERAFVPQLHTLCFVF